MFISWMQRVLPIITFPGKHNENFTHKNFSRKVFGCLFLFLGFFFKEVDGYIDKPYVSLLKKMGTVMLIFTTWEHVQC